MIITVGQLVLNGIVAGASYAALAIAVGLLYRVGGFYAFTVASLFAVASYSTVEIATRESVASLAVSVIAAVISTTALAVSLEIWLYRPLRARKSPPLVPMLASIGVVVVVENVLELVFGPALRIPPGFGDTLFEAGPWHLTELRCVQCITCTTACFAVLVFIRATSFGLTLRAVASNPILAALHGIRPSVVIALTTVIAAALISLPAFFTALDTGATPQTGNLPFLMGVAAVLVSGNRGAAGWIGAGVLMGILQQVAVLALGARWADSAMFVILCGALILRHRKAAFGDS